MSQVLFYELVNSLKFWFYAWHNARHFYLLQKYPCFILTQSPLPFHWVQRVRVGAASMQQCMCVQMRYWQPACKVTSSYGTFELRSQLRQHCTAWTRSFFIVILVKHGGGHNIMIQPFIWCSYWIVSSIEAEIVGYATSFLTFYWITIHYQVGVYDLAGHPTQQHLVAAGGEDGALAIWDMRSTAQPFTIISAHCGPSKNILQSFIFFTIGLSFHQGRLKSSNCFICWDIVSWERMCSKQVGYGW